MRTVFTPIISAATSSSRMAIQARPMRERSRLRAMMMPMTSRTKPRYTALMPWIAPNLRPKKLGGSIGLMPSGPPVRFAFSSRIGPNEKFTFTRFLKTMGTISPKPRVTIAR